MKCRMIIATLVALCMIGCTNSKQSSSRLDDVEQLIQTHPDSALSLLKHFGPAGDEAERARYALLYSAALEENRLQAPNDSLIQLAWEYYKDRPKELHRQCQALYYWGRIKSRSEHKTEALRLFLEVEEKLSDADDPYYTGLLYRGIGEMYYLQMNYNRAYHYFREGRNYFRKSNNINKETVLTLDMAAAAFYLKDMEKALRLYSAALDLADEQQNNLLSRMSLSNLSTVYLVLNKQMPADLLNRIERSARQDSVFGYQTMVDVHLLRNRLDSARHYLKLAQEHTHYITDITDLEYTAYRIEAKAKNFEKATEHIHNYIYMSDSLTQSTMQFSAGMVEREYYKERNEFAKYRMKAKTTHEMIAGVALLVIACLTYYILRQKWRRQLEQNDYYLLLAEEANSEYKTLAQKLKEHESTEDHLKGLIASRFSFIDKLGKTYYERENMMSQQAVIFQEVKQLITDFSENEEMMQELEDIVNTCHDHAMTKLKADFPTMKPSDIRLLCYIFTGFSPQVISLFMKDTVANVYARKSRLKSRIKAADTENKELFLSLLS